MRESFLLSSDTMTEGSIAIVKKILLRFLDEIRVFEKRPQSKIPARPVVNKPVTA